MSPIELSLTAKKRQQKLEIYLQALKDHLKNCLTVLSGLKTRPQKFTWVRLFKAELSLLQDNLKKQIKQNVVQ